MADSTGEASSSKKAGDTLEEYRRESALRKTGRGIKRFYTEDSQAGQRIARGISKASPLTFIRNIFNLIWKPFLAILILVLIFIGFVFVGRCSAAGTCAYAGSQINKALEKTGTEEAVKGGWSTVWDIIWSGGSSELFDAKADIRESDIKQYIDLLSPPDKVYFEGKPITVATSIVAYNLSEETNIDLLCTLDGYGENSKISYTYQKAIPGVLGEKRYSVVCTFEDGLSVKSENSDFFDTRRGVMTLSYSSNAKSNWCLYMLSKSVLEDYNLRNKDPLEEIKRRDPQCISGNNAGATIPEFVSAEQLIFGVLDDQPFTESRDYFWQLKLKEAFDYKGNLDKLDSIYVYVPQPARLAIEDSSCQFETSSEIEGYNYRLKKDAIDFVNQDCNPIALKRTGISVDECIQRFKEDVSFGCPLRIEGLTSSGALPEKVIVKAYANYSYELRQSFIVAIKKLPTTPTKE